MATAFTETDPYEEPVPDDAPTIDAQTAADAYLEVDRHLAGIRRATQERDDILATYTAEIERLEAAAADIRELYEHRIEWHKRPVESWHRAHPQKRTYRFPSGTISLRVPTAPKAWVADTDAVLEWARTSHPEILKAPNVTDVRKVVELVEADGGWKAVDPVTGEVVDGLSVDMPEVAWSYRVADGHAPTEAVD